MKQRVGKRSANAVMEQDEHEGNPGSLVGEVIEIAFSVPLEQAMGFHLAQVISELGEGICFGRQSEFVEDGFMNIGRAPSVQLRATVQQHLHQPYHPGVVDLDTGDVGLAGSDG